MNFERILITGGAGLIGSHIADLLVRQFNPEIVILDNFVRGRRENLRWALTHGRVEVVEGDIRDAALVHEVMNGVDIVFHQAAIRITQCAEDPRLAMEVMADGTFNVLEAAAAESGKKSGRGFIGLRLWPGREVSDIRKPPSIQQPHTVRGGESLQRRSSRSFHDMYGLDYVALRYFNVYGPRMDVHGAYTEVLIRWMDRLAQRTATSDSRRWHPDNGLRLCRRHRQGQCHGSHFRK